MFFRSAVQQWLHVQVEEVTIEVMDIRMSGVGEHSGNHSVVWKWEVWGSAKRIDFWKQS